MTYHIKVDDEIVAEMKDKELADEAMDMLSNLSRYVNKAVILFKDGTAIELMPAGKGQSLVRL